MTEADATAAQQLIDAASHIVVLQADNPDADSLGSALALEELLENQGKQVTMYCGTTIPSYLSYIEGHDRMVDVLPSFDASIIVDASTKTLFQHLESDGKFGWITSKPILVIDHHASVQNGIEATHSIINPHAASTGEMIFHLAKMLDWEITPHAASMIMVSILGDTQGLTNNLASSETYRIMAELIDAGADRVNLEERRREQSKMEQKILYFKADLIHKTTFEAEGQIASVTVTNDDIKEYSPLYNPGPLVQGDLLQTKDVRVAIIFKVYDFGRVTGSIRCNNDAPIANKLAEAFQGGGHAFAAGFKQEHVANPVELKQKVLDEAKILLKEVQ